MAPRNGMVVPTITMTPVVVNNTDNQGDAWFSIETGLETGRVTLTTPVAHFDLTAGSAVRMAGGLLLGIAALSVEKVEQYGNLTGAIEEGFHLAISYLTSMPSVFEVGVVVAAMLCGNIPSPAC